MLTMDYGLLVTGSGLWVVVSGIRVNDLALKV
jgi:hypothetical protein